MVLKITVLILWILFAILEGYSEGAYWHFKNGKNKYKKTKGKEHSIWTVQRAIVVFFATYLVGNLYYAIIFALVFPFWHDGIYYLTRRALSFENSTYRKGFWDFSTTSTAYLTKFNTPLFRTLYFIYGIAMFIYLTF